MGRTDIQAESQCRFFDHVLNIGPPIVETPDFLRRSLPDIGGHYLIAIASEFEKLWLFFSFLPFLDLFPDDNHTAGKCFLTFSKTIFKFRYFHAVSYVAVFQSSQLHLDWAIELGYHGILNPMLLQKAQIIKGEKS